MKKLVIGSLIFAATSFATAQVSLTGKVSQWMDSSEVGNTRNTSMMTEPTSNFALSVSEKMGLGLTARAAVETSLRGNTLGGHGTQMGDRQATVGVAHAMGSLDLGRNVHTHFLAITNNDAFGTLYGSVAGDVHNLRGLRFNDAAFVSLSPMKNVTANYDRTQTALGADATAYGLSAQAMGIKASAARFEAGTEVSTVVGLNAQVMGMQVFYTHSTDEGAANSKGDLVGVTRKVGPLVAKGSYGRTNADITAYAVGLDYPLSKRTVVGVAYRNVDKAGTNADVSQLGIGITHLF